MRHGISVLNSLLEEEKANSDGDLVNVPHCEIAALSGSDAAALGLPPDIPLRLDIRSDGDLANPNFRLQTRWIKRDGLPLNDDVARTGSIVNVRQRSFRIHEPIYSVIERIESFNANPPADRDERMLRWGEIRSLLGETPEEISSDYYLRDTRVFSAGRFTLRIDPYGGSDVAVSPVLMGQDIHSSDLLGDSTSENSRPVLPERFQVVFGNRFEQFQDARTAYALDDGTYVVIDPACRDALSIVRRVMRGTAEDRQNFCRNPRAVLARELGETVTEDVLEQLFVETEAFSNRVREIGLWQKKVLPWVQRTGESWLPPEQLGLLIGGDRVELDKDQLKQLEESISTRLANGGGDVDIQGRPVPATEELLQAVRTLIHEVEKEPTTNEPSTEKNNTDRNVLLIQDNLDNVDYQVSQRPHRSISQEIPALLKTSLKDHQVEGLRWMQSHWMEGSPGALLADDMGLGKTLEVLAFIAWIREEMAAGMTPRKPVLIVAPVGLLRNWEAEHDTHILPPGLGEILPAYGAGLRNLKKLHLGELNSGQSVLDRDAMQRADWILTSYETLRDYQISFGLVPFSVVVFDEAQKIKTPGTLMTEAAKAVNAEFTITMTGTPVENRLADLWCIADTAQPGVLGDLKSFSQKYERDVSRESLQALKDKIWHSGSSQRPGLMIRRMKEDCLSSLPQKHLHPIRKEMAAIQADAYSKTVLQAHQASGSFILQALHHLRSVSLHPFINQAAQLQSDDEYIRSSARLSAAIEVLDQIHDKGEKALIFLESLDMQDARELPLVLRNRYQLPTLPLVINGTVVAPERQKRVDLFQKRVGFDVMILSPRAGGVGLTLTAANHVIHLSRWWNPAVEDQCTDRVYRIGQKKDVHVYFPIAIHPQFQDHSFDLKLHALIERKRELSRSLLIPPNMSPDDVNALFKQTVMETTE